MKSEWTSFKRNEVWDFYESLKEEEKDLIEKYIVYRKARGIISKTKIEDTKRRIIQYRFIFEKPLSKMTLDDYRSFGALIHNSNRRDKDTLLSDLKNYIKFSFKDWSVRFNNLEDVKYSKGKFNEEKINSSTIISKKEVEDLVESEPKTFWRAFLLTQYEGGLRTGEVRGLKWKDVNFNLDQSITQINIFATKTKKARTIFVKKATFYLDKLRKEQENLDDKGQYIFHSVKDKNKPIDKSNVANWFRRLSKRVLGVEKWNYLLRHSRATELYRLAKENKISKDTAIKFMGHSEDMSATYTHLDKEDIEKMLKDQVYNIEDMPTEKKSKLENDVIEIKKLLRLLLSKSDGFMLTPEESKRLLEKLND